MTPEDAAREERIFKSYLGICTATDRGARKEAADQMVAEIRQRSAERVAEMERERGLGQ